MARKPRSTKTKDIVKNDITEALSFVCLNQKNEGTVGQTHCLFANGYVTTFDGIIALGFPLAGELTICPQSKALLAALERSIGAYSMTQLDATTLAVQAGKFRASIPCLPLENVASVQPDAICGPLSNVFKGALALVGQWASETANCVEAASVLCRNGSVLGTDRVVAVEYWHGLPFPEMVIPKMFITQLCKIKYDIIGFGFSDRSLTIHFSNRSWIKTQLYEDKWGNIDRLLNREVNPISLPSGFKSAISSVRPFTQGKVFIGKNKISSHKDDMLGASFDFECGQVGVFNPDKLLSVVDLIEKIDFCTDTGGIALFYGRNLRGAICQMVN